jgi:hypothetical protein
MVVSEATDAAGRAADAVRVLNHATIGRKDLSIAEVYEIVGSSGELCQRLPQAFNQLAVVLEAHLAAERLGVDDMGPHRNALFTVHATKKLFDRLKTPAGPAVVASTSLGGWYATLEPWKRPVVLFVNTASFFPVFMPLAPAATLLTRFPDAAKVVFDQVGLDPRFVDAEIGGMRELVVAKTGDRQMLGVMNELGFMAEARIHRGGHPPADLVGLSVRVADTLLGPLYKTDTRGSTPLDELRRLVGLAMS